MKKVKKIYDAFGNWAGMETLERMSIEAAKRKWPEMFPLKEKEG